jgi:hypothetical protein
VVSSSEVHDLFFDEKDTGVRATWGTVASYSNGTAEIALNPSVTTTCTCLTEMAKGDRAYVLISGKSAVAIRKAV